MSAPSLETRSVPTMAPAHGVGNNLSQMAYFALGQRLDVNPRTREVDQLSAYRGWCFSAASIVTHDLFTNDWQWWDGDDHIEDFSVAPINKPNALMSWNDLIELGALQMLLAARSFLHLVTTNPEDPNAPVIGINVISPSWITRRHHDPNTGILMWWEVTIPGRPYFKVPYWNMVIIREPHPEDPYKGMSRVEAFALSYDMDMYARAYTTSTLKNNGQIPGIIHTEQELTKEQADVTRKLWVERHNKGGGTTEGPVVLGRGAKYEKVSMSIADLEFLNLAQLSMEQIYAIFHVPPSKAGIMQRGGTREVTREAANAYAESALLPVLKRFSRAVDDKILPRVPEAQGLKFKYKSPIRRDLVAEEQRAREALRSGAIRVNTFLKETGRDSLGPEGEVFYMPTGIRVVEKIEPYDPLSSLFDDEDSSEEDEEQPPQFTDDEEENEGDMRGFEIAKSLYEAKTRQMQLDLSAERFIKAQSTRERSMRADVRSVFSREAKMMVQALKEDENLRHVKAEGQPGDADFVDKVLTDTYKAWEAALAKSMYQSVESGFKLMAGDGIPAEYLLSFDIYQEQAAIWARDNAGVKVREIQESTRSDVGKIVADGIEAGDTVDQMANKITARYNEYKGVRAQTIARTETSAAVNEGKWDHANEIERQHGIALAKTWNSVDGERTREHHRSSAIGPAITLPLNRMFVVDNEKMKRPLDPSGSARNVINCRCTLTMEVM